MQLVNQSGTQILPNSGCAATEADVAAAGCSGRLLQSGVNAFGDKAKLRASRHPERRPRVMRQHEDGRVIRRFVAPPAFPAVVRPGAPDRTEHLPPHPCGEEPLHQLRAPDAERILETLVGPGPVAVDGNREALDAEFRHYIPRCLVSGTAQLTSSATRPSRGPRVQLPRDGRA